ncbi:MAG: FAD-dependent oxidoreductase, partial [Paracoccaceae bacterium]
ALGRDMFLSDLIDTYDAVFLGMGLAGVNALGLAGEEKDEVRDAVSFIADLRQSSDLSTLPVGRHVVVIGGGMTAVDAAVQSKLLGAQNVHLVYRRGRARMNASKYEQDLAASRGVNIITNAEPIAVHGNGAVREVEFSYTVEGPNGLERTEDTFRLPADQVLKAIGQTLEDTPDLVKTDGRKIEVGENGRTSHPAIWAGGDCASGGDDLTVTAVAEGRNAAEDIHRTLMG